MEKNKLKREFEMKPWRMIPFRGGIGNTLRKFFPRKGVFRKSPDKAVSKKAINAFWERFDSGKIGSELLCETTPAGLSAWHPKQKVFAVTSTVLGTVRTFANASHAKKYVEIQRKIENIILRAKPKTFELQRVQFLSVRGHQVLERVYLAPTLDFLLPKYSTPRKKWRYADNFIRKIRQRGFEFEKIESVMREAAGIAWQELETITFDIRRFSNWDIAEHNTLCLDYDPISKKFLFATIDPTNIGRID